VTRGVPQSPLYNAARWNGRLFEPLSSQGLVPSAVPRHRSTGTRDPRTTPSAMSFELKATEITAGLVTDDTLTDVDQSLAIRRSGNEHASVCTHPPIIVLGMGDQISETYPRRGVNPSAALVSDLSSCLRHRYIVESKSMHVIGRYHTDTGSHRITLRTQPVHPQCT
jgi:hypothetical protein